MIEFEEDIRNCITVMEAGGTIVYPTDTIWGIGCDALNEAAVEKVFNLKQRPKEKSLIVLLADAKDILKYIAAPPPDIIGIIEGFTRPTTVIYNHPLGFPDNVVNADDTIAIRVTTDPFCKALIKRLRRPLVSTSANVSGSPSPANFNTIENHILQEANYTVNWRQDDNTTKPSSRIIRILEDGTEQILRP